MSGLRASMLKSQQELFESGYLDVKHPVLFNNLVGYVRVSSYMSTKDFENYLMRLRQYYMVGYEEGVYYTDKGVLNYSLPYNDCALVRVFPKFNYPKLDPDEKIDKHLYGIIYTYGSDYFRWEETDMAFDYIPDENNDCIVLSSDEPVNMGVKPVKMELLKQENADTFCCDNNESG